MSKKPHGNKPESALQRELRKRQPFEHMETEVTLNLMRTADKLRLAFARLFKRHNLTDPQYNVLRILRGHGTGVPCNQIAGEMITFDPDLTRLLDRLEKSELVRRSRPENDRRVVLAEITPKGLEVLAALDAPVNELHKRQLAHMKRAELETLNGLLVRARQAEQVDQR
jgi:DNA-binding MarR family transcriptional regulator